MIMLSFVVSVNLAACVNKYCREMPKEADELGSIKTETADIIGEMSGIDDAIEPITSKESTKQLSEEPPKPNSQPSMEEVDWSSYFQGLNGSAVMYLPGENLYMVYNEELSSTRRSPCSTFKIISSLIGMEHGVIAEDNSVRKWSGETFWNDSWNRDIGFKDAFQTSCVWYFRKVADDLGQEVIQKELNRLKYGNCDISDWEGRLNNNNNNRSLTGFWIESSLKISPKEQVEVLERIFGETSAYSEASLSLLKDAMKTVDSDAPDMVLYGKTGLGKSRGILVDAWFTGFAETDRGNVYFCVYLGESDKEGVSSADAKRIAVWLMRDNFFLDGD